MITPTSEPVPAVPVLYTEEELARMLRLETPSHVKRHGAHWPHVLIARQRLFRPEDVAQIVQLHAKTGTERPTSGPPEASAVAGRATRGSKGRT